MTIKSQIKGLEKAILSLIGRFHKLLRLFWSFLNLNLADPMIYGGKTIVVALEKGRISFAYGDSIFGKVRIKCSSTISIQHEEFPKPAEIKTGLLSFLQECRTTKRDITLCIPKAWVVVKNVEFPLSVRENLSNVITYELDRITPFSADEAFYDYLITEEGEDRLRVTVAAVRSTALYPYIDALKEDGITISRVNLSVNGLGTLLGYLFNMRDGLVVNIRSNLCETAQFQKGMLTKAGTLEFDEGESEQARVDRVSDLIRAESEATSQNHIKPVLYVFVSNYSELFGELLKNRKPAPIRIIDERHGGIIRASKGVAASISAGALIEGLRQSGLNLLSRGIRTASKNRPYLTIILLLSIAAMTAAYLFAPVPQEKDRIAQLEQMIKEKKPEVAKIEALKKEIEALEDELDYIDEFKSSRIMAIDIMKELTNIIPKSAWLTRMRVSDKNINIEGYAASATELIVKLEASKYFQKVEFSSPTFRDARLNMDRFQIKMDLRLNTEDKVDEKK